jgi:dGTPase
MLTAKSCPTILSTIPNPSGHRTDSAADHLLKRRYDDHILQSLTENPFVREENRISNCRSFKRLQYKTQQFVQYEGDLRNRLTHTLFVEKIATSLGGELGLQVPLVQAIALGHDLGHTPFGHVGERCLNALFECYSKKEDGIFNLSNKEDAKTYEEAYKDKRGTYFKHNHHSVNIAEHLAKQYLCLLDKGVPKDKCMPGLNLTLAVVDGMLHHTGVNNDHFKRFKDYYTIANEGIDRYQMIYRYDHAATLEGQLVNVSDEIAQVCHDLEDGMKNRLIDFKLIVRHPFFEKACKYTLDSATYDPTAKERTALLLERIKPGYGPTSGPNRQRYNSVRNRSIAFFIKKYLERKLFEEIRNRSEQILIDFKFTGEYNYIGFDTKLVSDLKEFHHDIIETCIWNNSNTLLEGHKSQKIIRELFESYVMYPGLLPESKRIEFMKYADRKGSEEEEYKYMPIVNYISGMEDKFATKQYLKLTTPHKFE